MHNIVEKTNIEREKEDYNTRNPSKKNPAALCKKPFRPQVFPLCSAVRTKSSKL